jgi:hypothetical protein
VFLLGEKQEYLCSVWTEFGIASLLDSENGDKVAPGSETLKGDGSWRLILGHLDSREIIELELSPHFTLVELF